MIFSNKSSPKSKRHAAFLYAVVFNSAISTFVILFLFLSFFVQPIHQAYAQTPEDGGVDEPVEEELTPPETAPESDEATSDSEEVAAETDVEEETVADDPSEPVNPSLEESDSSDTSEETIANQDDSNDVNQSDDSAVDSVPENSSSATDATQSTSSPVTSPEPESPAETASTTIDSAPVVSDSATTTVTDTSSSTSSSSPQYTSTSSPVVTPDTSTDTENSSNDIDTENTNSTPNTDESSSGQNKTEDESSNETDTETNNDSSSSDSDNSGSASSEDNGSSSDNNDNTTPSEDEGDREQVDDEVVELEEQPERIKEVEYLVTEQNYYQFSKQSCVSVGDGAYHCSADEGAVVDQQAVVYSEIGESGNQEIFIKTARGEVEQITDNAYDDSAPHYDPESMRIAWQRQIDGRYQIILFDVREREETQLTFARTNSMEPAVSEAGVVWQSWDGNDWEVTFYDGTYTENLTDNDAQDVAPVLEDEYVIWTVIGSKSQTAQVYSIQTKETTTIVNHEGGSIVNPRFVLVYDTQFENGDIVTQGFDPETGFSAPIAAQSAPDPIDIPESDSTGEIRALIQNKSSKESLDILQGDDTGTGAGNSTGSTTASSSEPVLDLKTSTSTEVLDIDDVIDDTPTTTEEYIELDEFDLIITEEEVAKSMDNIADEPQEVEQAPTSTSSAITVTEDDSASSTTSTQ